MKITNSVWFASEPSGTWMQANCRQRTSNKSTCSVQTNLRWGDYKLGKKEEHTLVTGGVVAGRWCARPRARQSICLSSIPATTGRVQKLAFKLLLQGELHSYRTERQHCHSCREMGSQSSGREIFLKKKKRQLIGLQNFPLWVILASSKLVKFAEN